MRKIGFYIISFIAMSIVVPINGHSTALSWKHDIAMQSFIKIDTHSSEVTYYSFIDSTDFPFIRAHYIPDEKAEQLGYKLPEKYRTGNYINWQWRIIEPPANSDESVKGKGDSGASVYLLFKPGMQTHIIKYVFSSTLPAKTTIKKSTLNPIYKMHIVVIRTVQDKNIGQWQKESVNFSSDYKKLFQAKTCPPLLGIGIMSDGDQTHSQVIADYADFSISREN